MARAEKDVLDKRPDCDSQRVRSLSCCAPARQTPPGRGVPRISTIELCWPRTAAEEALWLPGGRTFVGTDSAVIKSDGEGPKRPVTLKPFGLERHAVTTARFQRFVAETGHVTEADRFGWSYVFYFLLDKPAMLDSPSSMPWWRKVEGACWSSPEGFGSDLQGRENHPVTHISWRDAVAFAAWCGGRLPTEAEWEFAARGGCANPRFPWGDEEPEDGRAFCNIWDGSLLGNKPLSSGYFATCPVDAFAPNGYGFYNMSGNVWEWCVDAFRVRSSSREAKSRNREALRYGDRVLKGGSYLCHKSYCYRYRIAARSGRPPDSTSGNIGFRIAYDAQAISSHL